MYRLFAKMRNSLNKFRGIEGAEDNSVFEFWKRRTVRIQIFDNAEYNTYKGTGVILNKNLVLTNKHLLP